MNAERGIGGFARGERARVLAVLRSGKTAAEAAEAVGRSPRFLSVRARTDGELRLALEGAPVAAQRAARKGDYLAALTRTGNSRAAAREIRAEGQPQSWREADASFREAEKAILRMLDAAGVARRPTPRAKATVEQLEKVADELEAGESLYQACEAAGVSQTGVRQQAERSERLRAALPPPRRRPAISGRRKAAMKEKLPGLWVDPDLPLRGLAEQLGISVPTVVKYAMELGLPRQRVRRRGARGLTGRGPLSGGGTH